uniref:DNA-directed DNA polymerase n=1 Tax=Schizaphis graminum TaxID=13262 RepID=A0A2S2NAY5_SCHGA
MTKDGHKRFLCKMCLNSFDRENKLNDHKHYCANNKAAKIVLPESYNKTLEFENYNNSLRIPFEVIADFEATPPPIYIRQPNDTEAFTKCYQKHIPNNFCYYIKYSNGDYKPPVEYSGPNVAEEFLRCIYEEEEEIYNIYDKILPMQSLNVNQRNHYYKSDKCNICERFLTELPPRLEKKFKIINNTIEYYKNNNDTENIEKFKGLFEEETQNKNINMRKVCDHDHLTGKYRGAAHSICNLTYQNPKFIPIVCHNLSGYDAHLFIKEFGKDKNQIKLIPNNEEKYISFSKMIPHGKFINGQYKILTTELRFIDSLKFLPSSLDKLANNLKKYQFKELGKFIPKEHLDLVTRKLAYPYEYMDCEEKFNETCLPPIEKFYSSLTDKNVTIEEYKNSQKIWEVFNIKNLREFTSLYNLIDVLLLTDIMENFRDISLANYKLDPLYYYTTPGFAWNSMLRMTNIKLDLLTDVDQILMFESGIRGGLSQCSQRYSKANNKYMGDKFNKKEESKFLEYLDANNLYGWSMSKYLPTGDFKWVDNLDNFDIINISDKSPKGYILEVDLSYPKELHDLHSDFPLAPENSFDNEQLPKLLTTLYDKKNYIIHYETLKLYIKLGLKLEKIHRVLEFSQSPWLKVYIDFNTNLRSEAKNDFEKEYFKLMNNSVYGRTMMNFRNHVDIRLCSNGRQVDKLIAKPNFDKRTIFTENLAVIHMKKREINFKQPIYIGMCVLDLSKLMMYNFYYNVIKKKYGNNVRLL